MTWQQNEVTWTQQITNTFKVVGDNNRLIVFLYSGKSTGFVVTSKVTHASPAPLYAVCPDRTWENDALLPKPARHQRCKDIGAQLVDTVGANIDVRNCWFLHTESVDIVEPIKSKDVGIKTILGGSNVHSFPGKIT